MEYSYNWETLSGTTKQGLLAAVRASLDYTWNEIINGYLNKSEIRFIKRPDIVLDGSMKHLGYWRGYPENTIVLNLNLVLNHPWYAVLDVFYHEVAHQLKDFCYPNVHDTPHSKIFCSICHAIGANPEASTSITELDIRLFSNNEINDSGSDLIGKIKKLLSLGTSDNENEASLALSKAMELMAKYGFEDEDLVETNPFVSISLGESPFKMKAIASMLSFLLTDFWQVKTIWTYEPNLFSYVAAGRYDFKNVLSISGTMRNVKIASYVYNFLLQHIKTEWNAFKLRNGIRSTQKNYNSFCIGVLSGLRSKLETQVKDNNIYALIHAGDIALEEYYGNRWTHVSSRAVRRITYSPNICDEGMKVGRNMTISPGVEAPSAPRQLNK